MKKLFTGICVLIGGLTACTSAFADFTVGSDDSGFVDDMTPFLSTIMVDTNEIISDVEVTVNMNHDWLGDISATLSNGTTTIDLMIVDNGAPPNLGVDDGAGGLDSAAYTFSDSGMFTILQTADDLRNDDEVPAGTYLAEGSFSIFDDQGTLGDWVLSIIDNAQEGTGGVDGWSIDFTSSSAVPEPGSATVLGLFAIGFMARRRR